MGFSALFIGNYRHNLDSKNRVKVPSKFLSGSQDSWKGTTLYLGKGMEGCLFLFSEEDWKEITGRMKHLSLGRQYARDFQRLFFANTYEVTVDGSGRILVPEGLKKRAGITREIVFLGAGSRIELWDAKQWESREAKIGGDYESFAETLFQPGSDDV